jgi:hypothetical protein
MNRDYQNLGASTITMVSGIKGNVEIMAAYELLCLIYPKNPDGTKFVHPNKTRNKIPYFGVPNSIVCIKYKGAIRGIRQNEGQMNNVVSIDLQCCNKNINFKLAKTNIQLTGANSEEMGIEAFNVLCSHLNMVQSHLTYRDSLSTEIKKNTIQWLLNEEKLDIHSFDFLPEDVDKRLAMFLYTYSFEFDTKEEFESKIQRVMEIPLLCSTNVEPDHPRISNSVYNYSLGKEISLINMTKHLRNKGFNVAFHNWSSTSLYVSIPIIKERSHTPGSERSSTSSSTLTSGGASIKSDVTMRTAYSYMDAEAEEDSDLAEGTIKKVEKIKVHRFIIYRGGSIKQTSPTRYHEALDVRNSLLEAISDFKFE